MVENDSKSRQKVAQNFHCEFCDYTTSKKCDYNKHLSTDKHQMIVNGSKKREKSQNEYKCICGKVYKYDTGYYRHKKICDQQKKPVTKVYDVNMITTDLIMELIKDNKDMKQLVIEQSNTITSLIKNGITNTNHSHNNTNSHNKTFNLQFFLNETCKDAMNITDFVESIKLQLSDLERIGEVGYVEGISSIITTNLKALDVTQRPLHCTDKKRETMYIKDENKWEKDDDNKTKLKQAINKVANKNIKLLPQFREKYPDYKNAYSKVSDVYDKMIIEVMSTEEEKNKKIIHNISRYATIEKFV